MDLRVFQVEKHGFACFSDRETRFCVFVKSKDIDLLFFTLKDMDLRVSGLKNMDLHVFECKNIDSVFRVE